VTSCPEAGEEAAVALLTRQPVPARIAEHLQTCPACRPEWERLSRIPELLAATADAELAPELPAGPALLERLLAEAARSRRRRRAGAVVVAAAAAAAVVALAVPVDLWLTGAGSGTSPGSSPGTSSGTSSGVLAEGTATRPESGAWAYVEVRSTGWGSDVAVATSGLGAGTVCQIVVVDRRGRAEKAGSWTVSTSYRPGTAVHETVHTPALEIARVDLVDESSGARLLAVPIA
jgi:hypothetical protein